MSNSLPLVRVLVSKYPVLYQKSNCDNFDDAEEVIIIIRQKGPKEEKEKLYEDNFMESEIERQ